MHSNGKEKLVVEVVEARILMSKHNEGSSSSFVEVGFENQQLKTQVKYSQLNPVWNEKLVFHVNDVAALPYQTIEVKVFSERRSRNTRKSLGTVRVSGSAVVREGEQPQLYTYALEKRSLFSHVRGELSLKLYLSTKEEVIQVITGDVAVSGGSGGVLSKKNKRMQQQGGRGQESVRISHMNPVEPGPGDMKPVVNTSMPEPVIPSAGGGGVSNDYSLKETSPHLGGVSRDKTSSTNDLVEEMQYLYIRVVKARELPALGGGEAVAEVKLGNYKGITNRVSIGNAEWNQVFAFSKDSILSSVVEIFVRENNNKDDFMGRVWFDLNEVPKRVPSDSQLAPQWYRMEDKKGERAKSGQVMVSIWFGTQADEAFAEAWDSKAANAQFDGLGSIKSKVYLSPKLWYLRVGVIEAQDVVMGDKGSCMNPMRYSELFAKVQVGNHVLRTRIASPAATRSLSTNPYWNEELLFVVAEPFEDYLTISIEDHLGSNRDEVFGRFILPIAHIERRFDDKLVASRWFNLDTQYTTQNESRAVVRFASRIHLRVSLDGGYHVLDEATIYSSDVRPTARQLWKPHIGVLEVGILKASNLIPMKMKEGKGGSIDAYCVAKYGQKWVRTRTRVDSLDPEWNEQHTWEVFDPCTVISIGLFDNSRVDKNTVAGSGNRDTRIGKVRIRLSRLETHRVYTHAFPLLMLHPSGVKKMGELHLAVRFSCANMLDVLRTYVMPLLPKMHYVRPLSVTELDSLRYQALNVVASRLSQAEPPLGREVVEYMLDHDSHMWSMRKSKANFLRLTNVLAWFEAASRQLEVVRSWHKPVYSMMIVSAFFVLVLFPELVIPCILLTMAVMGMQRYSSRPRHPPYMLTRLSCPESVFPDELDEEFNSFPMTESPEIIRMRYNRLQSVVARFQTVVGDLATQGERFQALFNWHDPRATLMFVILCLLGAFGFYLVPIRWVVVLGGAYIMRPPKLRNRMPSSAVSFFKRLPTNADGML